MKCRDGPNGRTIGLQYRDVQDMEENVEQNANEIAMPEIPLKKANALLFNLKLLKVS